MDARSTDSLNVSKDPTPCKAMMHAVASVKRKRGFALLAATLMLSACMGTEDAARTAANGNRPVSEQGIGTGSNGDPNAPIDNPTKVDNAGGSGNNNANNNGNGGNPNVGDAGNPSMPPAPRIKAGFGVIDMTPDVGYCAGQYCAEGSQRLTNVGGGAYDPFVFSKLKESSDGVQSRLTARALVIEGNNGKRIALLKTDNYLAQDQLQRRVAGILQAAGSTIGYDQILHHVTHNHSSAYSSTIAAGVWVFEDAYDARFFEYQAQQMAKAILAAERSLKPARIGATTLKHRIFKGNVVGLATADDGTPAGYPLEYGDLGLVVMRIEDLSDLKAPKLMGTWVNHGQHPESLDSYNMHSADFLGALERYIDRETGAPLVFSQGDVGSAESSGNKTEMLRDDGTNCGTWAFDKATPSVNNCPHGQGVVRDSAHKGYAQMERNVRYLADDVIKGLKLLENGSGQVPMSGDLKVDFISRWVAGPLSQPIPGVSNCNTDKTANGNPGAPVLGLPDCARAQDNGFPAPPEDFTSRSRMVYDVLKAEGVPVPARIPDSYGATAYNAVEENARLRLQVFVIGDVVLASCACEPQADLILNLESRLNDIAKDQFNGFDWACLMDGFKNDKAYEAACELQKKYFDPADTVNKTNIPGGNRDPAAIARMRAQVHNDAKGWDAPENALQANSEPSDVTKIKGNFTREEIQDLGGKGFKLAIGVGHAGDYNGYTVSYREFRNRDHYRKALTAYGPHTADYMVTRLVRMAASLQTGKPVVEEPHQPALIADEARAAAAAAVLGQTSSNAYQQWLAQAPNDPTAAAITKQPAAVVERFSAAEMSWVGGSTAIDNPRVHVERKNDAGQFVAVADQTGEVATHVTFPSGGSGAVQALGGQHTWIWTARFEAYTAFPARLGSTQPGEYRFCIVGRRKAAGSIEGYRFCSNTFEVKPYSKIAITDVVKNATSVSFTVPAIRHPIIVKSEMFPAIKESTSDKRFCVSCNLRPWAVDGKLAEAVLVVKQGEKERRIKAACDATLGRCSADVPAGFGAVAVEVKDTDGNTGVKGL